jgi:hypothetical protein
VMGQVGHADSRMTADLYAQLQQRFRREHGRTFDLWPASGSTARTR